MKNKNKIMVFISFTIIISIIMTSCNNMQGQEYDFENTQINYISTGDSNYAQYTDVNKMIDAVDLVVIATPVDTFKHSVHVLKNSDNDTVKEPDQANMTYSYTERTFKVLKVYKGDESLNIITVCERAYPDGDGINGKAGDYISIKDQKYILFLNEGNMAYTYFTTHFKGKYSLKAGKNEVNKQIDQIMFKEVKEIYKDDFIN